MSQPNREPEPESEFVDSLIRRHQESTADHLDRRMKEAQKIKDIEEASSQRRLDAMWAREDERQREIAKSSAERRLREKALMKYVLLATVLIIIVVLLATVALAVLD